MSKKHFLEFEQPIAELETKIEELRYVQSESAVDISEEIDRLSKKSQQLTKEVYASVAPWQVYQVARHPQRPQQRRPLPVRVPSSHRREVETLRRVRVRDRLLRDTACVQREPIVGAK